MAAPGMERKLTAILSADVAGYSRLMGDDEEATVTTLNAHREVFSGEIGRHRGRVVDAKGDAILAEFASVVDAVNSAVAVQGELSARNAGLPEERRMAFRIGVNLGDVIVKDDAIYGDGVNVAARLESLAEPGGICISRSAYDQIKNKLKLECEYMGEQQVKNIAEPVRAYRVILDAPQEPPAADDGKNTVAKDQELALPDKPSIAVLAFENMSGDAEQEYFSDGISEDIITDLARIANLFVIARNASFTYKGKSVNPQQVGRELGVRFVLEGSVRKAANRVRITAQLIEAATGQHLWAERFDRELEDIFAVQDEITSEIVTALDVKLVRGEQARIWRKALKNPQARDHYYRGREALDYAASKEAIHQARREFEEVIRLEPDSPMGLVGLGRTHFSDALRMWTDSPEHSLDQAWELARKAVSIDDSNAGAHSLMSVVFVWKREHDQAIAEGRRAAELEPNSADIIAYYAMVSYWSCLPEQAIELIRRAMRLSPVYPVWYRTIFAIANEMLGNYKVALSTVQEALRLDPDYPALRLILLRIYCALGKVEEARSYAEDLFKTHPGLNMVKMFRRLPFPDPAFIERAISNLKKAGIID